MSSGQVTPDRETHYIVDAHDPVVIEPTFGFSRELTHMQANGPAKRVNVHFAEGYGWTLTNSDELKTGWSYERESVQKTYLNPTDLDPAQRISVPNGWEQIYQSRKATELVNAYVGANADYIASIGGTFFRKKKTAGTDWDNPIYSWPADEAAFVRPDIAGETGKLDRVAVTPELHNPGRPLKFFFVFPGAGKSYSGAIGAGYFCGPAGADDDLAGYGQYEARIEGDGLVKLFEKGVLKASSAEGWIERAHYQLPTSPGGFGIYVLTITPRNDRTRRFPNGAIQINICAPADGFAAIEMMLSNAFSSSGLSSAIYRVPNNTGSAIPVHQCAVRVDMRRDHRGTFAVALRRYKTTGHFYDLPFDIGFYPTLGRQITVRAFGLVPAGCTMVPKLYLGKDPAAATECTLVSTGSFPSGGTYATYTIPAGTASDPPKTFFVGIWMTGDELHTPVLTDYSVIRDGLAQVISPTEIDLLVARTVPQLNTTTLSELDITAAGSDPTHEAAVVEVRDPLGRLQTPLGLRSGMCVRIETKYDPADAAKRCILHRGYVELARAITRGRKGATYPSESWKNYNITSSGVWSRLETIFPPSAFVWAEDPNVPPGADGTRVPFKVTDVMQSGLSWAGFLSNNAEPVASWMCDIGTGTNSDLDIRLWPGAQADLLAINNNASIADMLRMLAYDFLGKALYFDCNRGTYGKWVLLDNPRAPYKIVANFLRSDIDPAVITGLKLRHVLGAYVDKVIPGNATTLAGTAKSCPIWRDTFESHVVPPEVNLVEVTGSGQLPINGMPVNMCAVAVNTKSFDFYGVASSDPTSPDYIGHIKQLKRGIAPVGKDTASLEASIAWYCRRIFEVGAYALKFVRFKAPLLLLDHEIEAGRKRPLRWGDAVLVDGQVILIDSVSFVYHTDHIQEMVIEGFSPRI